MEETSNSNPTEENEEFHGSHAHSPLLGSAHLTSDQTYFKTRLRYYIPSLKWVSEYKRAHLLHDMIAGVSVAFILIPQSLSYAQALVKLPPIHGLYTAFASLIVYATLGMSRQLAVGPEALVAILTGSAISEYIKTRQLDNFPVINDHQMPFDPVSESIYAATTISFLVGFITFIMGFFRLGFLDSVLSRALLRGFISAVAIVVIIDLSDSLLGYGLVSVNPSAQNLDMSPLQHLIIVLSSLRNTHIPTLLVSGCSILFLLSMKLFKNTLLKTYPKVKLIPEVLFLVVSSTALSYIFKWSTFGIKVLQDVNSTLPTFHLPSLTINKINAFFLPSVMISLIGFVESIAVAKTYANKCAYSVSPNRELIALGSSNIAVSFLGGWPAFGSLGRSAVNHAAEAKTQLAGFITGSVILVTMVFFLPLFYHLPRAVCSGVIVVAAMGLIETEEVGLIIRLRAWTDFSLMLLTFFSTLFFSIEVGTLISVGTSLLLVVKRSTKIRVSVLGKTYIQDQPLQPPKLKFRSTEESEVHRIRHALILRIEDSLFFGNAFSLKDRLKRLELYGTLAVHPGEQPDPPSSLRCVIMDMSHMASIDVSGIQALSEIINQHTYNYVYVCFVKMRKIVLDMIKASLLVRESGYVLHYGKISECVDDLALRGVIDRVE